jgi:hypothetical protein
MMWPSSIYLQMRTHNRRFRDGFEKSQYSDVREYQGSDASLAIRSADSRRELHGDLDDQIHIPWRGRISVDSDCNSSIRASSYPRAGCICLSLSQWGFGNWIHAISATRSSCRRWWSSRRQRTVCPFIEGRTRDCNQTLVGAGRPPPAACSRCSPIDLHISADP